MRYRVIDGEGVVVRQSAAEVLVVNDVAVRILGMADGTTAVSAWIDTLIDDYEVERPALERDVLAFAAELVEQGLLEPVGSSPKASGPAALPPGGPGGPGDPGAAAAPAAPDTPRRGAG